MSGVKPRPRSRTTYKAEIQLFPEQWETLRAHVVHRGITGGELIAAILSEWIAAHGYPVSEAPLEEPPEDA